LRLIFQRKHWRRKAV